MGSMAMVIFAGSSLALTFQMQKYRALERMELANLQQAAQATLGQELSQRNLGTTEFAGVEG